MSARSKGILEHKQIGFLVFLFTILFAEYDTLRTNQLLGYIIQSFNVTVYVNSADIQVYILQFLVSTCMLVAEACSRLTGEALKCTKR